MRSEGRRPESESKPTVCEQAKGTCDPARSPTRWRYPLRRRPPVGRPLATSARLDHGGLLSEEEIEEGDRGGDFW